MAKIESQGYCLSIIKEPPANLTVVTGVEVFDECLALIAVIEEKNSLYFYKIRKKLLMPKTLPLELVIRQNYEY
ncbi:hypothetical protein PFDSM3638_08130 [Pyrococcus furiosus DSM 3638]|uniref:Uncharacterized protein n=3 Tax=Pyrococcus furiosus TaxID=2261 RepID=Q8U0H9_PYRFU|nr:hypothetical protein [Pyrococcus furiosus]AAL81734.1 hypothetical protein PF1610 [Pyrococcus furiosus DSM 3638]AFN05031.1 hypothetical protein PFC_10560 [Pyrococcus furiosus COM1]QEK79233.1 hypothetical protein PFDSM3638_08130 [Pyrococcus furiosus DSM 3638]